MSQGWNWWLEAQQKPENYYLVLHGDSRVLSTLEKVVSEKEPGAFRSISDVTIKADLLDEFRQDDVAQILREWHLVIVTLSGPWMLLEYRPENYETSSQNGF